MIQSKNVLSNGWRGKTRKRRLDVTPQSLLYSLEGAWREKTKEVRVERKVDDDGLSGEVGWEKREKREGKGAAGSGLLLWERVLERLISLLFPVTHALSGKTPRTVDLFGSTGTGTKNGDLAVNLEHLNRNKREYSCGLHEA